MYGVDLRNGIMETNRRNDDADDADDDDDDDDGTISLALDKVVSRTKRSSGQRLTFAFNCLLAVAMGTGCRP